MASDRDVKGQFLVVVSSATPHYVVLWSDVTPGAFSEAGIRRALGFRL